MDVIGSLGFGDSIVVEWLDASEATGRLEDGRWDTHVQSVGYFLGVKDRKTRHVIIARRLSTAVNIINNIIPFGMIESVSIQKRNALSPQVKRVLKKFVDRGSVKLSVD